MPAVRTNAELELKLVVDDDFSLARVVGRPLETRVFTSTYHDTADGRLARLGLTLRRRVENGAGLWQLKLPRTGEERQEVEAPGGPTGPPDELAAILRGVLHASTLSPVATLRTRREGVVVALDGEPTAEVVLDEVAVLEGARVLDEFRELEAELLAGVDDGLHEVAELLGKAGARPGDGVPKVFRVLGLDGRPPRPPRRKAPASEHLAAALRRQVDEVLRHDPGVRLGEHGDVHQLRVATRRLRAILRAVSDGVDPEWSESLRAELGWLADLLGRARDLDVLLPALRAEAGSLGQAEREAFAPALRTLELERSRNHEALVDAMSSERYLTLLDSLEAAAELPRLTGGGLDLEAAARSAWKRLRKAMRQFEESGDDDALHRARIHGKRARYSAELASSALGGSTSRFVARARELQDVIGEHQDAVVLEQRLRDLVSGEGDGSSAFAAGRLAERQGARRRAARERLPRTWRRLERAAEKTWS